MVNQDAVDYLYGILHEEYDHLRAGWLSTLSV
jgi:hypothetical protein